MCLALSIYTFPVLHTHDEMFIFLATDKPIIKIVRYGIIFLALTCQKSIQLLSIKLQQIYCIFETFMTSSVGKKLAEVRLIHAEQIPLCIINIFINSWQAFPSIYHLGNCDTHSFLFKTLELFAMHNLLHPKCLPCSRHTFILYCTLFLAITFMYCSYIYNGFLLCIFKINLKKTET